MKGATDQTATTRVGSTGKITRVEGVLSVLALLLIGGSFYWVSGIEERQQLEDEAILERLASQERAALEAMEESRTISDCVAAQAGGTIEKYKILSITAQPSANVGCNDYKVGLFGSERRCFVPYSTAVAVANTWDGEAGSQVFELAYSELSLYMESGAGFQITVRDGVQVALNPALKRSYTPAQVCNGISARVQSIAESAFR